MCGRYTLTLRDIYSLTDNYDDVDPALVERSYQASFNIAPSQSCWVIQKREKRVLLTKSHWGLIPFHFGGPRGHINARVETVLDKPSFRDAYQKRHCIVPATGFYEWRRGEKGSQPYYFHMDCEPSLFFFAGIYDPYPKMNASKEGMTTFAILTTEALSKYEAIHHRMPICLSTENARRWLRSEIEHEELLNMTVPLSYHPVSNRVNTPRNDEETLIQEVPRSSIE